jgi:dienelactone hydrolase
VNARDATTWNGVALPRRDHRGQDGVRRMEAESYWVVYSDDDQREEVVSALRSVMEVRRRLGLGAGHLRVAAADSAVAAIWWCDEGTDIDGFDAEGLLTDAVGYRGALDRIRAAGGRVETMMTSDRRTCIGGWRDHIPLSKLQTVPEIVRFSNAGNDLVGYLYVPPGEGPFPCMITNHGSGIERGSWDQCRPACGALLASWGVASFLPHRRGYGRSSGRSWQSEVVAEEGTPEWGEQLAARLEEESGDVVAAFEALHEISAVDGRRVGVMGSSFGGTTSLLAAAKCTALKCLVDFAGAAMIWDRAPRVREVLHRAAGEATQPAFYIQAANDYSVLPTRELSRSAREAGRTVWSKIYSSWGLTPHEGHLFESRGMQVWGGDVRRFLEAWL